MAPSQMIVPGAPQAVELFDCGAQHTDNYLELTIHRPEPSKNIFCVVEFDPGDQAAINLLRELGKMGLARTLFADCLGWRSPKLEENPDTTELTQSEVMRIASHIRSGKDLFAPSVPGSPEPTVATRLALRFDRCQANRNSEKA